MQTSDLGITYPNADADGFDEVVLGAAFQKVNDLLKGILSPSAGGLVPAARVYNDANESIATGSPTSLTFNQERFDTDAIHDLVVNNARLTCKTAGRYLIVGMASWAYNAAGSRSLDIRLNGATILARVRSLPGDGAPTDMNVSTVYALAVNDYVELVANQNSGGALNVNVSGNYSPEFSIVRVG